MKYAEVIIIGAGPAGISAAIQLKRYGIEPLVFEKGKMGGLLRNANLIENYPGFPKGISGIKLIDLFKKQFFNLNLVVNPSEVTDIEFLQDQFIIQANHEKYFTDYLIIASGTKPKEFTKFSIPINVQSYVHYDLSTLLNEKEKKIVIIGAGDAAFDYSINLSKKNQVILLNRGEERSCLPLLWERAKENNAIKYYSNSEINGINWGGFKLEIAVSFSGKLKTVKSDHIIFAIGRKPELKFLKNKDSRKLEEIKKHNNLFMIGDVKNGLFRQASISVGDGVKTAMKIYNLKQETL